MNTTLSGNVLGSARAESDKKMLDNAFIDTADYRALITTRDFNFVVGRRGTGKSALFMKMSEYFSDNKKFLINEVKCKEYDALEYESLLGSFADDYRAIRAITRIVWRANLLLAILFKISDHYKFSKCDSYKYLADYKQKYSKYQHCEILKNCIELVKCYASRNKKCNEIPGIIASEIDIENFNHCIRDALDTLGYSAIFLFDGLDEGWLPNPISTAILGGLVAVTTDFADNSSNIYPVLFVRDNIFRALAVYDKDYSRNIEGYTLRIRWDEASLFSLIANRLRVAFGFKLENDVKVWNRFVQRDLKDRAGFKKCLQYTLYRPRDLLVLLNNAFVNATREGRQEIIDHDIDVTSKQISKDRLSDLIKEYEAVFPGIDLLINIFQGRPAFDKFSSLVTFIDNQIDINAYENVKSSDFALLGSGKEVFFALYSIGFLGLREPSSGKLIFCHDGSPANINELDGNQVTCIHPCYWKALDIREEAIEEAVLSEIYDDYQTRNNPDVQDIRMRRIGKLISDLPRMQLGANDSSKFEDWVFQVVRILFAGCLSNPELKPNKDAIQRRDIVATNTGNTSFWKRVIDDYGTRQITFEIKNYEETTIDDYRQVASYTSGRYGKFGIIVSRSKSEGLSQIEKGWLKTFYHEQKILIFSISADTLSRCVRKIRNANRFDYTDEALNKRLDTFERAYLSLRHSKEKNK